jgi:hypothetical protein
VYSGSAASSRARVAAALDVARAERAGDQGREVASAEPLVELAAPDQHQ